MKWEQKKKACLGDKLREIVTQWDLERNREGEIASSRRNTVVKT